LCGSAAVDAIFQIQRSQRVAFSAIPVENNTAKTLAFTQSELDMDGIAEAKEPIGGDALYKDTCNTSLKAQKPLRS